MLSALRARLFQKHRTIAFPAEQPVLPDRFRGFPVIRRDACPADCRSCSSVCPTSALSFETGTLTLDMGKCLFCGACAAACPEKAISFSHDYRLSADRREDLVYVGGCYPCAGVPKKPIRSMFRRSLALRQVCAGGCNGCEPDINVLSSIVFDLGRFGITFVASPRHADGLLITGPVTKAMEPALLKTYEAIAEPKLVIAVGACALSGGMYAGHAECRDGAAACVPVDMFIPGCPPHPVTILDGLLRLQGRL